MGVVVEGVVVEGMEGVVAEGVEGVVAVEGVEEASKAGKGNKPQRRVSTATNKK